MALGHDYRNYALANPTYYAIMFGQLFPEVHARRQPGEATPMKLIQLLLQTSGYTVALVVMAGLVGGAARTGLLVLINHSINSKDAIPFYSHRWHYQFRATSCLYSQHQN